MKTIVYTEIFSGLNSPDVTVFLFDTEEEALKKFYIKINKFLDENLEDFEDVKKYTEESFYKNILKESSTSSDSFLDDANITPLMKKYFKITKEKDSIIFNNMFCDIHYQFKLC